MKHIPTIAIIGGGAAGMMATATIIESGVDAQITVYDKNDHLGAKVLISGGGRCNVTTGLTDINLVLKKYTRGSSFLRAAMTKFSPQACFEWFENHGVPLNIEKDLRVFPRSNDGKDIVEIFEKLFERSSVNVKYKTSVTKLKKVKNGFAVYVGKNQEVFDYVIITTGGSAYRETGSSGDGYAFAQELGHTITPLGPSLNSFEVNESWVAGLSGLSFENTLLKTTNPKIEVTGPFLFTHFGISGPVTFSLSSHLSHTDFSKTHPITVSIIPDVALKFGDWDNRLIVALKQAPRKNISSIVKTYFPQRFVDVLLTLVEINLEKKGSEISKSERQKLAHLLSGALTVLLVKRRNADEFVTAGGVDTDEIHKQTMESLISPGLFFAGEILNVDGVTGGFNLQSAWATGRLAGTSVAKILMKTQDS